MPKISACIVAYCDYDEVCAAVRSILHYTPAPDFALYVVDNGSPDGCGKQLAETDFGDTRVTVLPLAENIGFGKGHNVCAGSSDQRRAFYPEPGHPADRGRAGGRWPRGCWPGPGPPWQRPQLRYPDGTACSTCPAASRRPGCCWRGSWPRSSAAALRRPTTTTRCRMRI